MKKTQSALTQYGREIPGGKSIYLRNNGIDDENSDKIIENY